MKFNKNIQKEWNKLFKKYENSLVKECKGTDKRKILEVEETFGVSFIDSFYICDERYIFDSYKGWLGEFDLYSLTNGHDNYFNLIERNKELREYDSHWKEEWIAFYDYETWFYAILDTKTKQVYLQSSTDIEYIVWANSYEEWFEMVVDEVIEYGELRLETIENLLGIK